ncbi:sugar phosphate isomerase/epimerase family protein [Aeoliella mucimassa]|uniref:sugar phosphate isomerase/epimerase family protein n=1 Tax=Aeoliella mucimassa TaxID=2527972 RepID=UPI0018D38A3B|nr:TIM barrel protein [Aeoliella mucimassa]
MHHALRTGFDSIGLWRRKVVDFGEQRTIELLDDTELNVSSLGFAGGFTGCDGRSLDESIRDALAAVGSAARLNANCLIVIAGGQNNHIRPHRNRLFRQGIDEMLMAAEVAEVTLAIKPMHPVCAGDWSFLNSLEETLELLELYDSEYLKLVYDLYQFPELVESPALIADLVPHLALVQLADSRLPHSIELERCPLGEGKLPLQDTVESLLYAGYDGSFDVELMGSEIEHCDYQQLLTDTYEALTSMFDQFASPVEEQITSRREL